MKPYQYTMLFSIFCLATSSAFAVPCSNLSSENFLGNFAVVNQVTSKMLPVKMVRFSALSSQQALPEINDGKPVSPTALFQVSNMEFVDGVDPVLAGTLTALNRAALVSWSKVPDSCFLLWFSSDLRMATLNQILGQNEAGDLDLGADNRAFDGLQMRLLKH